MHFVGEAESSSQSVSNHDKFPRQEKVPEHRNKHQLPFAWYTRTQRTHYQAEALGDLKSVGEVWEEPARLEVSSRILTHGFVGDMGMAWAWHILTLQSCPCPPVDRQPQCPQAMGFLVRLRLTCKEQNRAELCSECSKPEGG